MIHAHVGKNFSDLQWMDNIRIAGAAFLPIVGLFRVEVCASDLSDFIILEITGQTAT
jgi:hypothetical protein